MYAKWDQNLIQSWWPERSYNILRTILEPSNKLWDCPSATSEEPFIQTQAKKIGFYQARKKTIRVKIWCWRNSTKASAWLRSLRFNLDFATSILLTRAPESSILLDSRGHYRHVSILAFCRSHALGILACHIERIKGDPEIILLSIMAHNWALLSFQE